jgi:hypothetical protein
MQTQPTRVAQARSESDATRTIFVTVDVVSIGYCPTVCSLLPLIS